MSDTEDNQTPFGPSFIAACVVVGAILVCGVVLLISGVGSDAPASTSIADQPAARHTTAATADPVATPIAGSTAPSSSACGPHDGDQAIPHKAPAADGWEVSRRVVVPRSTAYGPAKTDPDGFRHCFAQSPTGAVFAAYNAIAALSDQSQGISTVRKLMVPGPATDALIKELAKESPSADSGSTQIIGYRVADAGGDRATVMLAFSVESAYMSITLALSWVDGDWHLQPPPAGEAVGAPFAQLRDLSDFVKWSGV
ncbi:hypothetical protein AB0L70_03715 [Kribbella sp. NPDC051952]|uniref:hypothetical protein n=1 Tax=Kribbella sp. NPDC051952 TaxID=3154851 RepID=UPI0034219E36